MVGIGHCRLNRPATCKQPSIPICRASATMHAGPAAGCEVLFCFHTWGVEVVVMQVSLLEGYHHQPISVRHALARLSPLPCP